MYRVLEKKEVCRLFPEMTRPPERLWSLGRLELLDRPRVSIVGSRRAGGYARDAVRELARLLARRKVTVVSGAAMGIDAQAHRGAGPSDTVAVVAGGLDIRYPSTNRDLIEAIERQGLVLSRFEPGSRPAAWSFVVRNEMVVALGEVLVIAEAEEGSGSMRSAEYAVKMGKEIWVLPHRLGESTGTQRLLREGLAQPILSLEEFARRFGEEERDTQSEEDEFIRFCLGGPSLEETLARFGARVYAEELEGHIEIEEGRVRVCR